jgi:ribulose-bisphosphate carboxylase large chain
MEPVRATYRLCSSANRIEERARALVLEQTVELPDPAVRDTSIRENVIGTVEGLRPSGEGAFLVDVAYPAGAFDGSTSQLLNVLFGNSSLQPDLELIDATLPGEEWARFGGPRFGIDGIRERAGVPERALTCAALKPIGLGVEELASLAATFARAGVDVIKEDHGIADQRSAPFAERVPACARAVAEVKERTGRDVAYVPHISGAPNQVLRRIDEAREWGASGILIEPMIAGLPFLTELVSDDPGLPVLAHPALGGAARIAPELLFGTLFRLFGADAVIFPHHGGRFAWDGGTCTRLAERLRVPRAGIRPSLPVPAGGMAVERVPELIRFYGHDVMLLIGGSLYLAGDALEERTRGFVRAVDSA